MIQPQSRANLYGFLSRLFVRELDDGFADALGGELGRLLLPAFWESEEPASLADPSRRQGLFDADFAHLTMVNLVPYESFYRREDGMIEAGLANPLVQFYRTYGFEADLESARALSPDHLGIELEFMAALAQREQEALKEGQQGYAAVIHGIQARFLREHLLAWAPVYLLAAQRNAKTVLYRDGAEAVLEFLLQDYEWLCS
jgi:TorA maturation chaperone TorD